MSQIDAALDALIAVAQQEAQREAVMALPCFRTFCSGLGPNEADGDDAGMAEFCQKAGYRRCPRCEAAAEVEA